MAGEYTCFTYPRKKKKEKKIVRCSESLETLSKGEKNKKTKKIYLLHEILISDLIFAFSV